MGSPTGAVTLGSRTDNNTTSTTSPTTTTTTTTTTTVTNHNTNNTNNNHGAQNGGVQGTNAPVGTGGSGSVGDRGENSNTRKNNRPGLVSGFGSNGLGWISGVWTPALIFATLQLKGYTLGLMLVDTGLAMALSQVIVTAALASAVTNLLSGPAFQAPSRGDGKGGLYSIMAPIMGLGLSGTYAGVQVMTLLVIAAHCFEDCARETLVWLQLDAAGHSAHVRHIIAFVSVVVITGVIAAIGASFWSKWSLVALASLIAPPVILFDALVRSDIDADIGFTGPSWETLKLNWAVEWEGLDFMDTLSVPMQALGLWTYGIGLNADLATPVQTVSKGLSRATLYLALSIGAGLTIIASCVSRTFLEASPGAFLSVLSPRHMIIMSISHSVLTWSAGLFALMAAARTLQGLARRRQVPEVLGSGSHRGDEPRVAIFMLVMVTLTVSLVGFYTVSHELLAETLPGSAKWLAYVSLVGILIVSLGDVVMRLAGPAGYRSSTVDGSLSGSIFIALYIILGMASLYGFVFVVVSLGIIALVMLASMHIGFTKRVWSPARAAASWAVLRRWILRLDPKRLKRSPILWRPQYVLLIRRPAAPGALALLDFVNDLKKGGLYIVANVLIGTPSARAKDISKNKETLNTLVDRLRIKAFSTVLAAPMWRAAASAAVLGTGIGSVKANSVVVSLPLTTKALPSSLAPSSKPSKAAKSAKSPHKAEDESKSPGSEVSSGSRTRSGVGVEETEEVRSRATSVGKSSTNQSKDGTRENNAPTFAGVSREIRARIAAAKAASRARENSYLRRLLRQVSLGGKDLLKFAVDHYSPETSSPTFAVPAPPGGDDQGKDGGEGDKKGDHALLGSPAPSPRIGGGKGKEPAKPVRPLAQGGVLTPLPGADYAGFLAEMLHAGRNVFVTAHFEQLDKDKIAAASGRKIPVDASSPTFTSSPNSRESTSDGDEDAGSRANDRSVSSATSPLLGGESGQGSRPGGLDKTDKDHMSMAELVSRVLPLGNQGRMTIDVWPMSLDSTGDGSSDTLGLLFVAASMLSSTKFWRTHTTIRLLSFVEFPRQVGMERMRLENMLRAGRFKGKIEVFSLLEAELPLKQQPTAGASRGLSLSPSYFIEQDRMKTSTINELIRRCSLNTALIVMPLSPPPAPSAGPRVAESWLEEIQTLTMGLPPTLMIAGDNVIVD